MRDKNIQEKLFNNSTNKDKFYLACAELYPNNPLLKAKMFEFFDFDIERVFNADKNDLANFSDFCGNIPVPKDYLSKINLLNPDKIYDFYTARGLKYVNYTDPSYPEYLKNIEDFPLTLFYRGDINFNQEKTLAIVGSRKATESAKVNVKQILSGFKKSDVTIVSGLASGIDTSAHRAALDFELTTAAVIGSGLNFKYPANNSSLYDEIVDKGGVIISEFPHLLSPFPQNFPQRNRIITGLSKGVIIAEAKLKSGAMASARRALEQNRELMCIPGAISNPNCEGIYHLLKTNAASIVTETKDVCDILNWTITPVKTPQNAISGLKKQIYDLISREEISTEGLKQKLDVGINELVMNLTEMELNGLIIQKNGFYYVLGI